MKLRRRKTERILAGNGSGRAVRFYRTYRSFHGGHLKVFDYFNHVASTSAFAPHICFSANSAWDDSNPWVSAGLRELDDAPEPDVLFLAGRDWERLDAPPVVPVINLIQHVRHADPGHPLGAFLPNTAIRICVSQEVADAVTASGANGPVHAIPNGIDLDLVRSHVADTQDLDLLIVANKKPDDGAELARAVGDVRTRLIDRMVPRDAFLDAIARARVTVFLPNVTEGFYLPALEAMALGSVVVCPDVIGNRSFCIPGRTAFLPPYDLDDIASATREAIATDPAPYVAAGREQAATHDLMTERARFTEILSGIDSTWAALG